MLLTSFSFLPQNIELPAPFFLKSFTKTLPNHTTSPNATGYRLHPPFSKKLKGTVLK
jgi:hypothetical protein